MKLKKLEINQFKNFGFLKIKNFINKKKLKELRNEVNKLSKSKNKIIAKYYQQNYLKTKDDLFRIEHFYETSSKFKSLIKSEKINGPIKKLIGKKAYLFKEKINIKPPFSREDRLHQDVQGDWLKYSNHLITILISLVDTNKKNGNLIFDISGNNKDKLLGKMFKILKLRELYKPNFIDLPLNSGDAVFFNGYIPHKSNQNNTNKSRTQIYITYCVPKMKNAREKYFLEKFNNCPPNQLKNKKHIFKN